ncbi:MAG: LytTR family DNA-binding domain-containing protein [Cytophagales bacterium]|nr:LytTR family DNA-binding domain-containing protein [Cytophagales bacterium]
MNCLIIEDEAAALRGLKKALEVASPEAEIVGAIPTVKEAIHWLQTEPLPDLVFMDIHLKDGSSFEILEKVDVEAPIIFCTAFDEYALKAFRANSIAYLLKPISHEDLKAALNKLAMLRKHKEEVAGLGTLLKYFGEKEQTQRRFLTKTGHKFTYVQMEEIAYFFKEHTAVYAKTFEGKKHLIESSLDHLEATVPDRDFFRINRQFLVAAKSIRSFETDYGSFPILLDPPAGNVTISRYRINDFKTWLGQ